ncbi:MAG TPA: TadG family pilus assembly protein [Gemmatimonadaceae bacterium]|nr:TadG family pilus assembly protein [Gemmatimonadaceae bacterium]
MRLRNRKGAMLVLGAFLLVGLMVMAVLAVDFSRTVEQSAAIHTAADAGAHAGAVELLVHKSHALDSAIAVASANMPPGAATPVAEYGRWNDTTKVFTAADSVEANAIRVTTQRNTRYLIGGIFNILPQTMRRTSIAWATAPVVATGCLRPWALPYDSLLARLGITNPNHQLTDADLTNLRNMPIAARRIRLKLGDLSGGGPAQPGNYNAIVLPSFWMALTGTYRVPAPQSGASTYRTNIETETCGPLTGVGDSIITEPGNMPGPTITATETLCSQFGGSFVGDNCIHGNGSLGVPIKVAYYTSGQLNGRDPAVIRAIGGFVLETMFHNSCQPSVCPPNGEDKGEIIGYFDTFSATGAVGTGNSTIVKPILVR